jgi:hypothetical protein
VTASAAPVGVVRSPSSAVKSTGTPSSSRAVAGAGTGSVPWALSTVPEPTTIGATWIASTPSRWKPRHAPAMSTIASAAPTSWKCTFSTGSPWTAASASASRVKTATGAFRHGRGQRAALEDRAHVVKVAMRLPALAAHVHLPGAEGPAAHVAHLDGHVFEPERLRQRGQLGGVEPEVDERAQRHVAADARERLDVGELHLRPMPVTLTRWAA